MFKTLTQALWISVTITFSYLLFVNCSSTKQEDPSKIKVKYNLQVVDKNTGKPIQGLFIYLFDEEPKKAEYSDRKFSDSAKPGNYPFVVFGELQSSKEEYIAAADFNGNIRVKVKFFYTGYDINQNKYFWPPQKVDTVLAVKALESKRDVVQLTYKIDPSK